LASLAALGCGRLLPEPKPRTGPLLETEKPFVGKWMGFRGAYRWEILREEDRSFEIAFSEPDQRGSQRILKNYAVGTWWVDGDVYRYRWDRWWGDEGNFAGVFTEKIATVEAERVVTLSPREKIPENIEVRVEEFEMEAWTLKPDDLE
ncbi:MAG: hypothetical protein AAF191_21505, partial [Verrucomicrobiota bacterium]